MIDRTGWPKGEWDNEPDSAEWMDEATGLRCRIMRNFVGALCGYVEVPQSHPHFERSYEAFDVEVHGGLTFSGPIIDGTDPAREVGFDCAHYADYQPALVAMMAKTPFAGEWKCSAYRNMAYVKAECAKLAKQLYEQS